MKFPEFYRWAINSGTFTTSHGWHLSPIEPIGLQLATRCDCLVPHELSQAWGQEVREAHLVYFCLEISTSNFKELGEQNQTGKWVTSLLLPKDLEVGPGFLFS